MVRREVCRRQESNLLFQMLTSANQVWQADRQSRRKAVKACGIREVESGVIFQAISGTIHIGITIRTTVPVRHGRIFLLAICHRGKKMMTHQHKISSGYFPDFKGDPAVLFVGDRVALDNLAAFLEALSTSRAQGEKVRDNTQLFATKHTIPLKVKITNSPCGMRRINSTSEEPHFEWSISKDTARRFAELTRAVAASENPCHQYLDAGEIDEITVMVSKDEYDESLFAL
jgi:hypothetical protein